MILKIKSALKFCIDNWQGILWVFFIALMIGAITVNSIDEARTSARLPAYHTTTSDTKYILNTSTRKFHKPSCGAVRQMNTSNIREYTGTREQVVAMGYDPCQRCHP